MTNFSVLPNLKFFSFNILLILSFFSLTKCDLPVHCLVEDIIGTWEITIEKETFNPSIHLNKTSCGHGFPNSILLLGKEYLDNDSISNGIKLLLTLKSDYKVYQKKLPVGNWTPIFDQSFLIYYKNSILTAPFKYYLEDKSKGKFVSKCGKSFQGWYIPKKQNPNKNWSCFSARKIHSITKKIKNTNEPASFIQLSKEKPSTLLFQVKYEELDNMVNEINKADLSWKAKVNENFKGLSFAQLMKKLGMNKGVNRVMMEESEKEYKEKTKQNPKHKNQQSLFNKSPISDEYNMFITQIKQKNDINKQSISTNAKPSMLIQIPQKIKTQHEKDSRYVTDYNEVIKYLNTSIKDIDENTLPLNWDWRNVGGINYVTEPFEQGECGSCFVLATIFSLESRLRIKTNNTDTTRFSAQFPLSCNFYSEGCDGGYPILVGKFFNEFEIIPEQCFKYTGTTDKCENVCEDYTKSNKKYIVSEYGYLGGFYGGTNEVDMMKEIRARGPIPGNLIVVPEFYYYESGIFSCSGLKKNAGTLNYKTLIDQKLHYDKVEHSITLVGYGEENGIKYWIGMNTWEDEWGEKGFFKILRGENDCNIESMGDYLNIDIVDRKNKS